MSELGDVLELMHGAHGRVETLRATIREWRHLARSHRAFEREVKESGATGYAFVAVGADEAEDELRSKVSESILRLWLEGRSRIREERESTRGVLVGPELAIKDGELWWVYSPEYGAMSNVDDPEVGSGVGQETEHLLDPSRLLAGADFTVLGRTTCAGREALRVLARPRKQEHLWPPPGLPFGADEHELLVDAERGILLRTATRIEGRDLEIVEMLEVAFDETFPPDTFAPPPGEEIRSPGRHLSERLSVEDASTGHRGHPALARGRVVDSAAAPNRKRGSSTGSLRQALAGARAGRRGAADLRARRGGSGGADLHPARA
ncbi:MAG: hypothetical protein H0U03_05625 [Actinobacteria bacterium]|nr:hypothetical protein [Actinomycetota bacterium]